jgi:hypothetical protein
MLKAAGVLIMGLSRYVLLNMLIRFILIISRPSRQCKSVPHPSLTMFLWYVSFDHILILC